ncbi:AAEL013259-PA [Aedes aegypti]|uniref:AAEL013259-PA n=1 Tax=Aedes aegypti TaxID=7159 RepID=Q16JP8_AEDAE|nr:AAEL013259-PA [Aedes aegypti]
MNAEFELKYQSMNVAHLLVDEVEYELKIRQVPFNVGDSRDVKRRRLRQKLKEQKEKNNFEIVLEMSPEECKRDLNIVDEKIAKIHDQLENRRTRKSELPELQTRLVHLYNRLMRLKEKVDTDGLEGIALNLYQEHFTVLTSDPDVRKRVEENLSKQLIDLSVQDRSEESTLKETEEENSSESEDRGNQNKDKNKELSGNTSTPKERRKSKKQKDSEEMFKKLLEHVASYLESRLSSISEGRRKGDSSCSEDVGIEEARKSRRKEFRGRNRRDSSSGEDQEDNVLRSQRRSEIASKKKSRREVSPPKRKSRNQRRTDYEEASNEDSSSGEESEEPH